MKNQFDIKVQKGTTTVIATTDKIISRLLEIGFQEVEQYLYERTNTYNPKITLPFLGKIDQEAISYNEEMKKAEIEKVTKEILS